MGVSDSLYDQDFFEWSRHNAQLLREGKFNEADLGNIAEEIESLGRSDKRALTSTLHQILTHLLLLHTAPPGVYLDHARGWKNDIDEFRDQMETLLSDSPSLAPVLNSEIPKAYAKALRTASNKEVVTEAVDFPEACPFTLEQIRDDTFYPARTLAIGPE
jgi:thioester reductase-like protein